jgi:hypothetical protein
MARRKWPKSKSPLNFFVVLVVCWAKNGSAKVRIPGLANDLYDSKTFLKNIKIFFLTPEIFYGFLKNFEKNKKFKMSLKWLEMVIYGREK